MAISREPFPLPEDTTQLTARALQTYLNNLGTGPKPKAILMVVSDDELLVKDCLQTFARHTGGQSPFYYVCESACRVPHRPIASGFVRTEEDFSVDFLYDTLRQLENEVEFPGFFDDDSFVCDDCLNAELNAASSPDGEGGSTT